jgi:hypothetical protein
MQVLKPTMEVIFNSIVLLVMWTFHCICEYALPLLKWVATAQLGIMEEGKETGAGKIGLSEENDKDEEQEENKDQDELDVGNMQTLQVPEILLNGEHDMFKNNPCFMESDLLRVLSHSPIHESKSLPDLLITDPLMSQSHQKVRPSSLDLQDLGTSQNNLSVKKDEDHKFNNRFTLSSESCFSCKKKIKFGKSYKKCKICKTVCHTKCMGNVNNECAKNKEGSRNVTLNYGKNLLLGDYIPSTGNGVKIPSLLKSCVEEIEARGLHEEGLYRISGSDKEIKVLKKKFLKNEPNIDMSNTDINVVCGTLKDFLRSLHDPLIPNSKWKSVTEAASSLESAGFHDIVMSLPAANVDCLRFLITHLQKVVWIPENKMSKENLGKILGPTVVGYSSTDPSPLEMIGQTPVLAKCMIRLLELDL